MCPLLLLPLLVLAALAPAADAMACGAGRHRCGDRCMAADFVCDGVSDCEDKSDERDCSTKCSPRAFRCADSGRCLYSDHHCDGLRVCADGSDEQGCPGTQRPQFVCRNKWRRTALAVCDGLSDCPGAEDETGCTACQRGAFFCKGRCIRPSRVCDGVRDCSGGEDEQGCAPDGPGSASGPETAALLRVGSKVVRGKDWMWGNQDGTPPQKGTVITTINPVGWVKVRWDSSGVTGTYRAGNASRYDLQLATTNDGRRPGSFGQPTAHSPNTQTTKPTRLPAPNNRRETAGTVAKAKCKEYSNFVYSEEDNPVLLPTSPKKIKVDECFYTNGKSLIIGGNTTVAAEFPHAALIGYGGRDNIRYQCGGSLISPNFVLTAGHCMGRESPRWVLLGVRNVTSVAGDNADPQLISVVWNKAHPQYKPPSTYWDVALLRLQKPAVMGRFVRPACLHTERAINLAEPPVVIGWGVNDTDADTKSEELLKVALPLQPHALCYAAMRQLIGRRLPSGILDDNQLCAGDLDGGKDACQGDSGGPLNYLTKQQGPHYCMYHIIGVTSFGIGCGHKNLPGVYARVSAAVPWIESTVWPTDPVRTK